LIVVYSKLINVSAISWREQINFQWDRWSSPLSTRPTLIVGYFVLVLAHIILIMCTYIYYQFVQRFQIRWCFCCLLVTRRVSLVEYIGGVMVSVIASNAVDWEDSHLQRCYMQCFKRGFAGSKLQSEIHKGVETGIRYLFDTIWQIVSFPFQVSFVCLLELCLCFPNNQYLNVSLLVSGGHKFIHGFNGVLTTLWYHQTCLPSDEFEKTEELIIAYWRNIYTIS
jgi:hypothetical protein